MSDAVEQAKLYIQDENYEEALKIAKKRHSKDDIEEYISILDLLIDEDYLLALEEKGMYYQYYDESHDDGDYGERYFDEYLQKRPRSINVICDKALSRFNKGNVEESLEYMDNALESEHHHRVTHLLALLEHLLELQNSGNSITTIAVLVTNFL
mgnify:CR=1 FL=1